MKAADNADVLGGAPTPSTTPAYTRFTNFSAKLNVEYDREASAKLGKDYWRVTEGFMFYFNDRSEEKWVYVPAGYLTDGATVPRLFWGLIPPWGQYGQAAVLHDWLTEHMVIDDHEQEVSITRPMADSAFKQGMVALNVPRWKRNVMYIAVRVYAAISHINGPTINKAKAAYEANWVAAQANASLAA